MENRYYIVKKHDSLWGIARHFGCSVEDLAARNDLTGSQRNHIRVGQKIYLPDGSAGPDLLLTVRLIGLNSQPLRQVKLELAHDGIITETQTDEDGWLHRLDIQNHACGLKIAFENYARQWQTIFDEATLPLGEKILQINVMTDLLKGRTWREDGAELLPDHRIGREIRKQTPQPAPITSPRTPLPPVPATPVMMDTRTSGGMPTTIHAPLFASDNLYLKKGNEKYRQAIIDTAKRYQLTPHALAAIIHAEAGKMRDGTWIETCAAGGSSARGLGQFLPGAWFQYIAKPGTLGNAEALKLLGASKLEAANNTLYLVDGHKRTEVNALRRNTLLSWRDHGGYSIDAIGSYAEDNLAYLKKQGIDATGLPPEEKVKIAYIMHHEGPGDGLLYLIGKLGHTAKSSPADIEDKLAKQLKGKNDDGTAKAAALADRFHGDYVKAYCYFLANHIDNMVRTKNFMLKHDAFNERSAYEVIQSVSGFHVEKPEKTELPSTASKPIQDDVPNHLGKEVGPADGVGGSQEWSDPLDHCVIRVGGYADSVGNPTTARTKSLFLGRGGKHKGIDLDAMPGTPVRAVANGEIIYAGAAGSYGNVILLKVSVHDLAPPQQRYARSALDEKHEFIYFLYAHLSEISAKGTPTRPILVRAHQIIGNSGSTGNASGMTQVGYENGEPYGAHLHFEVRRCDSLKKGEGDWFDPNPFIQRCF